MANVAVLFLRLGAATLSDRAALDVGAETRRGADACWRHIVMVGAIHRIARAIGVNRPYLLLIILTSCATTPGHQFAEPKADWQTRTGQLLYRNQKTTVIGDVVIRFSQA